MDAGASIEGGFEPDHAELDHAAYPPLVMAAGDGNINAAVDLLISRGADLHARGRLYYREKRDGSEPRIITTEGERPLYAAVAGRNLGVVRSLLRNGADPNGSRPRRHPRPFHMQPACQRTTPNAPLRW